MQNPMRNNYGGLGGLGGFLQQPEVADTMQAIGMSLMSSPSNHMLRDFGTYLGPIEQRRQAEAEKAQNAQVMQGALQKAGFSPEDAALYAGNLKAAQFVMDAQNQEKSRAADSAYLDALSGGNSTPTATSSEQPNRTFEALQVHRDKLVNMAMRAPSQQAMDAAKLQIENIDKQLERFAPTGLMREYEAARQQGYTGTLMDFKHAGESGLSITTADGTVIQQGPGVFGKQDDKNVANRVTAQQDIASSASNLKDTVKMLRNANSRTGYTGPGGGVYDAVDSTLEQFGVPSLPGDAGSRATMRSGGLDVALQQVQKTKGAISNAEMALFMAASPGLQNTPAGNAALLDMIDAIAERQIEKSKQMEKWRQTNRTLDGFEAAWSQYIDTNPILVEDGGQLRLRTQAPASGGADNRSLDELLEIYQ